MTEKPVQTCLKSCELLGGDPDSICFCSSGVGNCVHVDCMSCFSSPDKMKNWACFIALKLEQTGDVSVNNMDDTFQNK